MSDSDRLRSLAPLFYGLVTLVSVLALDRAAAAAIQTLLLLSDDRIAQIYAGAREDDVAILGNSVANAMANPVDLSTRTERRVFMMALHGVDAHTQEALARDYLALNTPPRLALLEARSARAGVVRAQDFAPYIHPGTHMAALLETARDTIVPWRSIFHVYRLNSPHLPKTLQNIVDRDDQATGASDGRITPQIIDAWLRSSRSERVEPDQAKAFADTIEAFNAAGTVPVVILAPVHPLGRDQTRFIRSDVLPTLPAGTLVCDFIDYLDEDRYFEDPVHLNRAGRAAIAPLFGALISAKVGGSPSTGSGAYTRAINERCHPHTTGRRPA